MKIRSGKVASPRRILMHGVPGVGKGTWANQSRRPVFVSAEDGLDDLDCQRLDMECETFDQVMQQLYWLYSNTHDRQTVVVDTVDWVERLIHKQICEKSNVQSVSEIPYGKGFDAVLAPLDKMMAGLSALRADRGMDVILLAHTKIEKFAEPGNDAYDRFTPDLHKTVSGVLQAWCTEVLFANYRTYTTTTDEGFGRKRVIGTGTGERVLYTTWRPSHVAKNRLNLPDEMKLEWSEFEKYLPAREKVSPVSQEPGRLYAAEDANTIAA
jgi:hypothetical protein